MKFTLIVLVASLASIAVGASLRRAASTCDIGGAHVFALGPATLPIKLIDGPLMIPYKWAIDLCNATNTRPYGLKDCKNPEPAYIRQYSTELFPGDCVGHWMARPKYKIINNTWTAEFEASNNTAVMTSIFIVGECGTNYGLQSVEGIKLTQNMLNFKLVSRAFCLK